MLKVDLGTRRLTAVYGHYLSFGGQLNTIAHSSPLLYALRFSRGAFVGGWGGTAEILGLTDPLQGSLTEDVEFLGLPPKNSPYRSDLDDRHYGSHIEGIQLLASLLGGSTTHYDFRGENPVEHFRVVGELAPRAWPRWDNLLFHPSDPGFESHIHAAALNLEWQSRIHVPELRYPGDMKNLVDIPQFQVLGYHIISDPPVCAHYGCGSSIPEFLKMFFEDPWYIQERDQVSQTVWHTIHARYSEFRMEWVSGSCDISFIEEFEISYNGVTTVDTYMHKLSYRPSFPSVTGTLPECGTTPVVWHDGPIGEYSLTCIRGPRAGWHAGYPASGTITLPMQGHLYALTRFVEWDGASCTVDQIYERLSRLREVPINLWTNLQDEIRPSAFVSASRAFDELSERLGHNMIEALAEVDEYMLMLPSLVDLVSRLSHLRINLRSVSDLIGIAADFQLLMSFGILPNMSTLSALQGLPGLIERAARRAQSGGTESRGVVFFDVPTSYTTPFKFSVETRTKISVRGFSSRVFSDLFMLDRLGLMPNFSNLWDLIPFSFVADWFSSIGSRLADIDRMTLVGVMQPYCYVHSYRMKANLTNEVLDDAGLADFSAKPGTPTYLCGYVREVSRHLPPPRRSVFDFQDQSDPFWAIPLSLLYRLVRPGR